MGKHADGSAGNVQRDLGMYSQCNIHERDKRHYGLHRDDGQLQRRLLTLLRGRYLLRNGCDELHLPVPDDQQVDRWLAQVRDRYSCNQLKEPR